MVWIQNAEIVLKGSLSWGSRPSSSTSNPWGSSAVFPNADCTSVSPRHPSNRSSSGGGGLSRPSTAGSDRHESSVTTWGPNSRPSSASGVLTLTPNQSTLTSSRPLSAETRPGSSHMSRFADNDFSLSSGDFPTLGSEKDNTVGEPHDHKIGTVDTWTRDSFPHFEDVARSNADKWQGGPQQYISHNVPPQHFDAWRGPLMNLPAGVWYRGPSPAGPPYPPVPHGKKDQIIKIVTGGERNLQFDV